MRKWGIGGSVWGKGGVGGNKEGREGYFGIMDVNLGLMEEWEAYGIFSFEYVLFLMVTQQERRCVCVFP